MAELEDEPDQEKRIEKLKAQLEELGGKLSDNPDLSADMEEQFLKHIHAFESAQQSSLLEWLENAGLALPPPEQLDDAQLREKLWEVIRRMASLGAYLHSTNHLNDRELYTYLFHEGLREDTVLFPEDPSFASHIDLVSSGSDEDIFLWMKYYADDGTRRQWLKDFPDSELPPHEDPPFNRDQDLPKSPFG